MVAPLMAKLADVVPRPAPEEVTKIDPLLDPRWERFVQSDPRASVFQSKRWLQVLKSVHGYKPWAITTSGTRTSLSNGLVFCEIDSWITGWRLVSLPFSDHCDPLASSQEELDALLLYAKLNLVSNSNAYVEIRPRSGQPGSHTGFSPAVTYYLHTLDLGKSESQLFGGFHKDCVQRKIRRAEREKLRYEEGISEDLLHDFYKLLVITRRRQFLPPQPLAWFQGLIASFGDALKIRVAYKDARPVASILTLSHQKTLTYKYGCSDAAFNNLGGTQLLFWNTIQQGRHEGFEELDLGRSDRDNAGLITFKEHWGALRTPLTYWTSPQRTESLPQWIKSKGFRTMVSAAPSFALQAVGSVLYRHIG